ncbi:MAG: hypothetical protein H6Q99_3649 [Proteobacteria bacterium]|nr:hypothetical protein [Pseudomonadota bacterium]
MKTVYQTDAAGIFIGEAVAHESPLEPGVFLIPAGCVESAPPVAEAGDAAVWSGSAWALVDDRRGESWYDGNNRILVDFIGDPVERGYTASAPPPTLDALRADKLGAIVSAAHALLARGAPVDSGLHIALDDGSRADLTAMAAMATAATSSAVAWPDSYARGWIARENLRVPLPTPAAGLALAASVGAYYAAIIQRRRDLKDAALSAEDAVALDAIDVSAGWPA